MPSVMNWPQTTAKQHQPLTHCPHSRNRGDNQDLSEKNSWIVITFNKGRGKQNKNKIGDAKALPRHLLPVEQCPANLQLMPALERLSPVLLLRLMSYGIGYPLPDSWSPSAYSLVRKRSSWCFVSTVQKQLKHCCVITSILIIYLKHICSEGK